MSFINRGQKSAKLNKSRSFFASSSSATSSASELSYLKAEVWALQKKLRDESESLTSLNHSYQKLALEKYELLDEFSRQNQEIQSLIADKGILLAEIEALQDAADKNQSILEKLVTQNISLKQAIVEANETIYQMGMMYLKLKGKKQ